MKTECHRGHPITPENIYRLPNGHLTCRECRIENSQKFRTLNPDRIRDKQRQRRNGGIECPERHPMPSECESCGREAILDFDHDHDTNEHRGWLCRQCNIGVGALGDNLEGVLLMVAYLQRYKEAYR